MIEKHERPNPGSQTMSHLNYVIVGKAYVYKADFDTIPSSMLYDLAIINEIAKRFDVDVHTAERLLDGRESEWEYSDDADDSWWLKGKRGECAKAMGYDGAQDTDGDGQGVVYIIPMTG